jgi:hypothetical protein
MKHNSMKMNRQMEILLHTFLTSALNGAEQSASCPRRKSPNYQMVSRLSGPQTWYGCGGENEITTLLGIKP